MHGHLQHTHDTAQNQISKQMEETAASYETRTFGSSCSRKMKHLNVKYN